MKSEWARRNARERGLILLAAVVIIGGAAFNSVIEPVVIGRADLAKRLPQLRSDNLDLTRRNEALGASAQALAARKKSLSETALRESLIGAQLPVKSVTLNAGAAELQLAGVSLGAVLQWATETSPVFGVSIQSLDVSWRGELADVRLRLAP